MIPLELGADGWLVASKKVVSLFRIDRISSKLGLAYGTDMYECMKGKHKVVVVK